MKRWLKTFLILVAIFLLPMLWLLFSHIAGKRAVDRYKVELRAAGEKLTVNDWLPPRVPSEQNSAKLLFQAFPYLHYDGVFETNEPPTMRMAVPGKAMIGWQQPLVVSRFENRTITNTWKDIEEDLKQHSPGLELLHQAAALPEIDFGLDYRSRTIPPNLANMKGVALLLRAATVSDLNRGQTSSAVTNLHMALRFINQWKNERTVISQLVRYSMTSIATDAQWEVLQATNLTDPELATLQHDWESMEFMQPLEQTFEMNRASEILDIEDLRTSNSPSASVDTMYILGNSAGASSNTSSWSLTNVTHAAARKTSDIIWRTSWSYHDELLALQAEGVNIEAMRQVQTNGFFNHALADRIHKLSLLGVNAGNTNWLRHGLNDRLLSWFGDFGFHATTFDRMMSIEGMRRIVIVAIALKRYQLRHGTWPADLKTVVPEFLFEVPRDPVDGLPLRYRTNADGTFTLYSIGYDGVDNDGDASPSGSSLYWQRAHDWVWPQPATPEETQQYYDKLK